MLNRAQTKTPMLRITQSAPCNPRICVAASLALNLACARSQSLPAHMRQAGEVEAAATPKSELCLRKAMSAALALITNRRSCKQPRMSQDHRRSRHCSIATSCAGSAGQSRRPQSCGVTHEAASAAPAAASPGVTSQNHTANRSQAREP
eukprot:917254-Alexandrium_andersonii.AAC.1